MAKLINCKSCGAQIAKSAKTCPQCGAKNKGSPILTFLGTFLLGVLILLFVVILIPGDSSTSTTSTTSTPSTSTTRPADADEEEVIEITAEELYRAYSENTVNADALYKNKKLLVTGTISDIGQDMITKKPCVSLDCGEAFNIYPVQCFFLSSSDELAQLRDGDTVTIYGKCTGVNISIVQLSGCELR